MVHNENEPDQEIGNDRICSQIEALNEDFNDRNARDETPGAFLSDVGDAKIQFYLATKDPDGQSTDGIVYVETTVDTFDIDQDIKFDATGGSDIWDPSEYLNIWVGNLDIEPTVLDGDPGAIGYYMIGGGYSLSEVDGVVINFRHFGTAPGLQNALGFNEGKTAVHEVGHWLNLDHTYEADGSCSPGDGVADTPAQEDEGTNGDTFPHTDACTTSWPGTMITNTMDMRSDDFLEMFSRGQVSRMRAVFDPGGMRQYADYAEGLTISGTEPICTTRSLSVSGLPFNYSVVDWESSDTNALTVSGSGFATRQNNYNGFVTVTATIGRPGTQYDCTSEFVISKDVWVGKPFATVGQELNGGSYYSGIQVCPGSHYVTVEPQTGDASHTTSWTVQSGISHYANGDLLNFTMPSSGVSSISITATISNSCGTGSNANFYISKKTWGCSFFTVITYPNPTKDDVMTVEAYPEGEEKSIENAISPDKILVFDMNGNLVLEVKPEEAKTTLSLAGLKDGEYIVHVVIGKEVAKKHIIKK